MIARVEAFFGSDNNQIQVPWCGGTILPNEVQTCVGGSE
jgi:hypothetical protein